MVNEINPSKDYLFNIQNCLVTLQESDEVTKPRVSFIAKRDRY
jgi:hypothetical protein